MALRMDGAICVMEGLVTDPKRGKYPDIFAKNHKGKKREMIARKCDEMEESRGPGGVRPRRLD